jgi:hypothetical protein
MTGRPTTRPSLLQDGQEREILRNDRTEPDLDSGEAAAYLAEMSGSLATIARRHGFDALGYIFDMAQEEAQNNARPAEGKRVRR